MSNHFVLFYNFQCIFVGMVFWFCCRWSFFTQGRRPDIFIHMMSSNVALEFKNIGNTNICSRHYLLVKNFEVSRHKSVFTNQKNKRIHNLWIRMCSKIKRIKEFKTFEFKCVRKSKEWKNSKRAICSVILINKVCLNKKCASSPILFFHP